VKSESDLTQAQPTPAMNKTNATPSESGPTCYHCGNKGHTVAKCMMSKNIAWRSQHPSRTVSITRLPFGVSPTPCIINESLKVSSKESRVVVYLDDILITELRKKSISRRWMRC
jgi:hypothetical protein